ncbi:MAG: molybdopterin-dependent oxidoreductase [Pseudomonadota bacterium]
MATGAPTPTICRICKENCGILVSDGGAGLRIAGNSDHPLTKGFLCVKGKNFGDVHHSGERLRQPLLKDGASWKPISFEEALDLLASKFSRIKEQYGARSVVFYKGESLKHQEITEYMRHLSFGFGSPNYITVGSLCHFAMVLGHSLTYGGIPAPSWDTMGLALLWGANPAASSPRMYANLRKAVQHGKKLVVIDPAHTQTTKLSTLHLQVTPGSDGFLALAFIKYGVEEMGLEPVSSQAYGWDRLAEMVRSLNYDDLLPKTGIGSDLFREAADLIFHSGRGWSVTGLGLELQPAGVQAIRAVACLQSLLDPDNRPGPVSVGLKDLPGSDGYPPMSEPIGHREAPLLTTKKREGQGMFLFRAVEENDPYPIRGMLVVGGNPLSTFPDFATHTRALKGLDFLAVSDLFMTATAQVADLVIPASDHLDNWEIHDYGQTGSPYLGLVRPSTSEPIGWPAWRLVFELAKRLHLGELFPFKDNREALAYRLSTTSIKLEDLEAAPGAVLRYEPKPRHGGPWSTSDGKVHYWSEEMASHGYPGLPEPGALTLPYATDDEFPLWLSTGDRVITYQHSQFRQVQSYRSREPEPFVDVHPDTAAKLNVETGSVAVVATRYGRVEVKARVTDNVRRDCIRMPHGWGEANANDVTGLEYFDPVSGFPWLRAVPARLEKKGADL